MSKTLVTQQFGPSAKAYAECEVHRSGASLNRVVEMVEPKPDWDALDIATGAGHTAAIFAPHVKSVIASDITAEMLQEATALAKERGLSNMTAQTAEAQDLPFADASFDLVTCRLAAHHFPNPEQFVAEVSRVLRPGGKFALVDNVPPDAETLPGLVEAQEDPVDDNYNAFEKMRDPSHARALSITEWKGYCEKHGLAVSNVDLMEKEMAFVPWVERMHCDEATVEMLRTLVTTKGTMLNTFLKPREIDGDLHFSLREAILVADKTA